MKNTNNEILTNRQKQAIATKNKIFDTTMRLGMDKGFEKLTVNEICREASISVGTFYHHFISIDAVIQEQYSTYDQFIAVQLSNAPLHGSAKDRLWQLFSLKYDYVSIRGAQFIVRQFRGQFAQIENSNQVFYNEDRITHRTVIEILNYGIEQGEFCKNSDIQMLANALLIFSRGITLDWALRNGQYDLKLKALSYLDIMINQYIIQK